MKVGGGQCIGRRGVNTVKTITFKKGGGCMTPTFYGGAAPDCRICPNVI